MTVCDLSVTVVILSVFKLCTFILNVPPLRIMLIVVILSLVILSVFMLSVVVECYYSGFQNDECFCCALLI